MPATSFQDHFSDHASQYARHRPGYPPELFTYISSLTPVRDVAWDCGTGSGQAAAGLVRFYGRVVATDPSAEQIANAMILPGIEYNVAPAEKSGLRDRSVDLVTVAQALHWFDLQAFYAEVQRVAKPHGVLVAWCYGLTRIDPDVDAIIDHYYNRIVGPYWPPQRHFIDECYATLPFPFAEMTTPEFHMCAAWDLDAVCNYLATWSATRRYREQRGRDPIVQLRRDLEKCWGDPSQQRDVRWPIWLRVGRVWS